jgi:DUF1680 family protein
MYSETCAAIGLVFFANAMLRLEPKGKYADVMERALYNTVLAGMAKDGKHYFYVNPLEVWPVASEKSPIRKHVKPERPGWYGCACCPPNVARLVSSLWDYVYSQKGEVIYANLYIGGEAEFQVSGQSVGISMKTEYPREGEVDISFGTPKGKEFTLAVRVPAWCIEGAKVLVNGEPADVSAAKDGYLHLSGAWGQGDVIKLNFPMKPVFMRANPLVRADAGKVALQRGPLGYCLEETDNGKNLSALSVNLGAQAQSRFEPEILGGVNVITAEGWREKESSEELYYPVGGNSREKTELRFVPYNVWGNRDGGEMAVWTRECR